MSGVICEESYVPSRMSPLWDEEFRMTRTALEGEQHGQYIWLVKRAERGRAADSVLKVSPDKIGAHCCSSLHVFDVHATGADVVGEVSLALVADVDGERAAILSYWTCADHRRRGYATAGAKQALRLAFRRLGVTGAIALITTDNIPSHRVAARLGFKPITVLPAAMGSMPLIVLALQAAGAETIL